MTWYGVGIDLGTSFSSAAVSGPEGTRMVPLSDDVVVPSVAYLGTEGSLLTGVAASGAATDPSQLASGFKRRLGDPTRLFLGGASYSAAALMAAQLSDILAAVAKQQGGPPDSIVLTFPAIWGPYRREHFAEVPRLAGVSDYGLVTEPEAAATHYSSERRLGEGEVVAVYDLGGGTFDTTILRMSSRGMEILGTPEGVEHMGGIDFDETLQANLDERLDGAISALDPEDPESATALAEIRALCVRAKEELSIEPDVQLDVPLPSGPERVTVSRLEFNHMIRPSVQLTTNALRRTIESAGLRIEELSAVLLAGGSSRIPLVSQLVSEEFGKPVRATLHPKFTVALGAAAIAARRHGSPQVTTSAAGGSPAALRLSAPRPAEGATTSALTVLARPAGPPAVRPSGTPVRRKPRKWLVTVAIAAVVAVVATVVAVLVQNESPGTPVARAVTSTPGSTSASAKPSPPKKPASTSAPAPSTVQVPAAPPPAEPEPKRGPQPAAAKSDVLRVFNGSVVPPWNGLVGSDATNWGGTFFTASGAQEGPITARLDHGGEMSVTWDGSMAGQVYFQILAAGGGPQDLRRYFNADGALVFDVEVTTPPSDVVRLGIHCVHPCRSELTVTTLFQRMNVGAKTTVAIPLSCFLKYATDFDPRRVNTPWLVYSNGVFGARFSNVRWVTGAASDPGAISC